MELFVYRREGFEVENFGHPAYQLNMALYGLCQSSKN